MFASTIIASLFALGAVARPGSIVKRDSTCFSYDEATALAQTWAGLIANYSQSVADASLSENFTDYSESVNSLIDNCPQGSAAISLPLLSPSFTNRSAFELGQSQQPPLVFNILDVFPGCGSVAFRWYSNNTAPISDALPVVGIIVLETTPNPVSGTAYPNLIDYVYSEFDAAAWLSNLEEAGICANTTTTASCSTATATATTTVTVTPTATTPAPTSTITSPPTTSTADPGLTTSTITDADGNVIVIVTSVDDVFVTATDVVTVTLS